MARKIILALFLLITACDSGQPSKTKRVTLNIDKQGIITVDNLPVKITELTERLNSIGADCDCNLIVRVYVAPEQTDLFSQVLDHAPASPHFQALEFHMVQSRD